MLYRSDRILRYVNNICAWYHIIEFCFKPSCALHNNSLFSNCHQGCLAVLFFHISQRTISRYLLQKMVFRSTPSANNHKLWYSSFLYPLLPFACFDTRTGPSLENNCTIYYETNATILPLVELTRETKRLGYGFFICFIVK